MKDDLIDSETVCLWLVDHSFDLGLGPYLFVKVPRPGDSEVIYGLQVKLPPVTTSLTTKR